MKLIRNFFFLIFILGTVVLLIMCGYQIYEKMSNPLEYKEQVESCSLKYNVEEALIYAVIKTESNFKPQAVSSAGAKGLMQITPETFKWLQKKRGVKGLEESDLFDPNVNIEYGVYFISLLIKIYDDEKVALSAYNAGMGNVDKWLSNSEYSQDAKTLTVIPYKETDNYVKKVLRHREIYKNLYFKNQ